METTADMRLVGIVFIQIVCNVSGPPLLDINCEENFYRTVILINCFDEVYIFEKCNPHTHIKSIHLYILLYIGNMSRTFMHFVL